MNSAETNGNVTPNLEAQLDALLDAEAQAGTGNPLQIHALINERRRKRAHAKAKATQPKLALRGTKAHDGLLDKLAAAFRTPLGADDFDAGAGAMDALLQTIPDTLTAKDAEDFIFSLLRVVRKVWAWNPHLGPIEGFPQPQAPEVK